MLLPEEGDRLIPAPALSVDARVEHETHRAPHLHFESAVALFGRVVEAHVLTQRFAVERPTFEAGGIFHRAEAAEIGKLVHLLDEREMHQVPWPRFVQR